MTRRQWIYFLLLNVLVSAVVTGTILYFYDRSHRPEQLSPASKPTLDLVPATVKVDIVSVVGAGTASSEIVVIKNNGSESFNLNGWMLKDVDGHTYTFPPFTIYPAATVQVHTTSGTDTFSDVYWSLTTSVWQSGESATLYDPRGNARAFYRIP
jgi:archaellum component FlaF (FlaF/FlaG flagellin family)